jgi:hypothetical protein
LSAADFRITDQTGRQSIVPVRFIETEHAAELDLRDLTGGMYFVRIRNQDGYSTIRIVKTR